MIDARYQKPVIVFIRIPKTGSTSLETSLKARISNNSFNMTRALFNETQGRLNDFLALSQKERDEFDFISGHIPMGIHKILSRPCRYITMLRYPLNHAISIHNYNSMRSKSNMKTIEESFGNIFDNMQTRRVLGLDILCQKIDFKYLAEMKFITDEFHQKLSRSINTCKITPKMFEKAKLKIRDDFFLTGVTEKLTEFTFLLSKELNSAFIYPRKLNISRKIVKKEHINPKTITSFLERNRLDMELYYYASNLFDKKYSESGITNFEFNRYKFMKFTDQFYSSSRARLSKLKSYSKDFITR